MVRAEERVLNSLIRGVALQRTVITSCGLDSE